MYRRWLVAHDFEPCAEAAADAAARIALACRREGADPLVVLAHVVTPPAIAVAGDTGAGSSVMAVIDMMIKTARERLETTRADLIAKHPDITVETVVLSGGPVDALLSEAERRDVDAIAVGSHGRRGIVHAFMGSVAERVVQRAKHPVFVLKAPPEPTVAVVA